MSDPIAKDGRVDSRVVLNWVRRQRCRFAEAVEQRGDEMARWDRCFGPIDPHHVDGKGLGGARCRDDRTVPLCRRHHDEVHATGNKNVASLMSEWANETRCRFLDRASSVEVHEYIRDLECYKERPLAVAW